MKPGRHTPSGVARKSQVTLSIQGIKSLSERLNGFSNKIKRKVMRGAVTAVAKVLRDEVKANVPKETKILSQSIVMKVFTDRRDATRWKARIGARNKRFKVIVNKGRVRKLTTAKEKKLRASGATPKTKFYNPSKYMHLIELGTKRGVSPHKIMASAVAKKGRAAIQAGIDRFEIGVRDAASQVARGNYY